jgi:hypothetical protein
MNTPSTSAPDGASGGSSNPAAATDSETTTENGGEADTERPGDRDTSAERNSANTTSPPDGELGAISSDPMESLHDSIMKLRKPEQAGS